MKDYSNKIEKVLKKLTLSVIKTDRAWTG